MANRPKDGLSKLEVQVGLGAEAEAEAEVVAEATDSSAANCWS